jgi:phage-related protein (TIGR01555 family)
MPNRNFMERYKTFANVVFNVGKDSIAKDAFSNAAGRMGYGTPSVAEGVEYILNRWTYDYWLMITLFRNHWIPRKVVEIPAKDMVKAWPRLNCKLTPDQIANFDRTLKRTLTQKKIKRAITWARLFGGAGALMVIDGHENILNKPLNLDDINPDSYKGLIVFDRWSGITPVGNQAQDLESPLTFGLPEFYTVHAQNGNEPLFDIHASRIIRFIGPDVPTPEHEANQYWGISVLELVMEEMRKRDNASWSILQLLFRAQIMTQVNPELAQMLSGATASGAALTKFAQTYQAQNELLSNQSMLILGKDGKLESHQYTFGGIADVLDRFEIAVAASSIPSIPYSKLFGKNSSGLDNSNDADERNYEEAIAQAQNDDLEPQLMQQLYPVICMSEFGDVPDDLDITWPSIRVLTEEDKSKLAKEGSEAILAPFNGGVTSQQLTLKELKQLGDKTEIFTNITDKMIDEADDKPQPPIEVEQGEARAGTAEFEESGKGAKANDVLPDDFVQTIGRMLSSSYSWTKRFVEMMKGLLDK